MEKQMQERLEEHIETYRKKAAENLSSSLEIKLDKVRSEVKGLVGLEPEERRKRYLCLLETFEKENETDQSLKETLEDYLGTLPKVEDSASGRAYVKDLLIEIGLTSIPLGLGSSLGLGIYYGLYAGCGVFGTLAGIVTGTLSLATLTAGLRKKLNYNDWPQCKSEVKSQLDAEVRHKAESLFYEKVFSLYQERKDKITAEAERIYGELFPLPKDLCRYAKEFSHGSWNCRLYFRKGQLNEEFKEAICNQGKGGERENKKCRCPEYERIDWSIACAAARFLA